MQILDILRKFWRAVSRRVGQFWELIAGPPSIDRSVPADKPRPAPPTTGEPELDLGTTEAPTYRKSKSLLTDAERAFYRVLVEAVAGDYLVFAKVRMSDIVWLANEPQDRKLYSNRVHCKHVDFLLCDKVMVKPLLVLELDDPTHRKPARLESDRFKDATFKAVGLPIRREFISMQYSAPKLREEIRAAIGVKQPPGLNE